MISPMMMKRSMMPAPALAAVWAAATLLCGRALADGPFRPGVVLRLHGHEPVDGMLRPLERRTDEALVAQALAKDVPSLELLLLTSTSLRSRWRRRMQRRDASSLPRRHGMGRTASMRSPSL